MQRLADYRASQRIAKVLPRIAGEANLGQEIVGGAPLPAISARCNLGGSLLGPGALNQGRSGGVRPAPAHGVNPAILRTSAAGRDLSQILGL
jgi:hypothetical protein